MSCLGPTCEGMAAADAADLKALKRIADPHAGVVRANRLAAVVLMFFGAIIAFLVLRLSAVQAHDHAEVYAVMSDGAAIHLGERQADAQPRAAEAIYTAKHFVSLVFELNSSTIAQDLAEAINMCGPPFSRKLRDDIASERQIGAIRDAGIRSEIDLSDARVVEEGRTFFKVEIRGQVHHYSLVEYERAPYSSKPVAVRVSMTVVPRSPTDRLNGLEVTDIEPLSGDKR